MQTPPRASLDIEHTERSLRYSTTRRIGLHPFPEAHAVRSVMGGRTSVLASMNAVAVWKLFAFASYRATTLGCIPGGWGTTGLLGAAFSGMPAAGRQRDGDFFALGYLLRNGGQPSYASAPKFHIAGVAAGSRARKVEPLGLGLCLRLASLLCRHVDRGERRRALGAQPGGADESTRALRVVQLVVGGARRRLGHNFSCRRHAGRACFDREAGIGIPCTCVKIALLVTRRVSRECQLCPIGIDVHIGDLLLAVPLRCNVDRRWIASGLSFGRITAWSVSGCI